MRRIESSQLRNIYSDVVYMSWLWKEMFLAGCRNTSDEEENMQCLFRQDNFLSVIKLSIPKKHSMMEDAFVKS